MNLKSLTKVAILSSIVVSCSIENSKHMNNQKNSGTTTKQSSEYDSISELYYRNEDGSIANSPQSEVDLVNEFLSKNQAKSNQELILLTTSSTVALNEAVRVIHIYRTNNSEASLYINGPKEIFDEYLDGVLVTKSAPTPEYPWTLVYDGRMLEGPGSDCGFDITSYSFDQAGEHSIIWKCGGLESNELKILVE